MKVEMEREREKERGKQTEKKRQRKERERERVQGIIKCRKYNNSWKLYTKLFIRFIRFMEIPLCSKFFQKFVTETRFIDCVI